MPEFVVHEHRAERAGLHHDFRLEEDDILESWAVPKGVPVSPGVKRLAIKVEDHPVSYAGFQGRIESGYGKGDVEIWDNGEYIPITFSENLRFIQLRGSKVKGNYYLRHWEGNKWLMWKQA